MERHRNIYKLAFIISHTSVYTELFKSLLILSTITLIFSVLQGCSKHPQDSDFTEAANRTSVKLAVRPSQNTEIHSLDALIFNNDMLQRLDCYQRIDNWSEGTHLIGSCSGNKILLLCANLKIERDQWRQYNSFRKTGTILSELENEEREFPVMTSCTYIKAGDEASINLERLSSEIALRSISCNFSGKPYKGETITDAKAYLINVNACSNIIPQENVPIERIINHGGLIEADIDLFQDKSLILCELGTINSTTKFTPCKFICYPNTHSEESIGSPFTRLVIEGKIQGETWYWPIDINREKGGKGIERNRRYIFDINILGKGTKDPNNSITQDMSDIQFVAEKWEEKESYYVAF